MAVQGNDMNPEKNRKCSQIRSRMKDKTSVAEVVSHECNVPKYANKLTLARCFALLLAKCLYNGAL